MQVKTVQSVTLDGGSASVTVTSMPVVSVTLDGGSTNVVVTSAPVMSVTLDGGTASAVVFGTDTTGVNRAIRTDAAGIIYVWDIVPTPFPLPACNPVRRTNCQRQ